MRPNVMTDPTPRSLPILYPGSCEPLKAVFHAAALGLAGVMGVYNAAAWLQRRQSHLAVNALIYFAAVCWEQRHVAHHLMPCVEAPKPQIVEVPRPCRREAA
jgi:hypothetical protein